MTWLARRRLSAGLRRLGHRPKWGRDVCGDRYAWCRDCVWSWGCKAVRPESVAVTLRSTDACRGR